MNFWLCWLWTLNRFRSTVSLVVSAVTGEDIHLPSVTGGNAGWALLLLAVLFPPQGTGKGPVSLSQLITKIYNRSVRAYVSFHKKLLVLWILMWICTLDIQLLGQSRPNFKQEIKTENLLHVEDLHSSVPLQHHLSSNTHVKAQGKTWSKDSFSCYLTNYGLNDRGSEGSRICFPTLHIGLDVI